MSSLTPLLFIAATALVKILAPDAKGSGIPQVLEAITLAESPSQRQTAWESGLISIKTAAFKVLSSCVGTLGGASIGREGPTVQIASSGFAFIAKITKKRVPNLKLPPYLVAGAAAGVAAAFNTPLAGVTFAIEELASGMFGPFRQTIMLAVIIAGITAQMFSGDYLYFGHPTFASPTFWLIPQALLLGGLGGLGGGLFAKLLSSPQFIRLPKHWFRRTLFCGATCAIIGYFTHGATAGSGYEITRTALMNNSTDGVDTLFPVWKLVTTTLSYLSGMAGGIFSPCLSIGAGLGMSVAKICHFANFKACALMGMVVFFSGAVQAPLTAVVIVMEMTDQHILILPFMIAAFLGHAASKLLMPEPLYHVLAKMNAEG